MGVRTRGRDRQGQRESERGGKLENKRDRDGEREGGWRVLGFRDGPGSECGLHYMQPCSTVLSLLDSSVSPSRHPSPKALPHPAPRTPPPPHPADWQARTELGLGGAGGLGV